MTSRASVTSLELLRIPVTVSPDEDPTGNPVSIAVPPAGTTPITFIAGTWETGGPPYIASITVGPGGNAVLDVGAYDVYVKVVDAPEAAVFLADRLEVFGESTLLASVAELAALVGSDINPEDARANTSLAIASALIRKETGQLFTSVEGDEIAMSGSGTDALLLPELPVNDITEVLLLDDVGEETEVDLTELRWDGGSGLLFRLGDTWPIGRRNIQVTYDHGYSLSGVFDEDGPPLLPDDVRGLCLEVAAGVYGTNLTGGTLQSEQIGSYRYELADPSQVVQGLTGLQRSVLERYRVLQAA